MNHAAEYDIICLQEMFGAFSWRRAKFIAEAKNLGFCHHFSSPVGMQTLLGGFLVDGGLLILSKFPFAAQRCLTFSRGNHSDAVAAKGALYVLIQPSPGQFLHIFNTHPQASYPEEGAYPAMTGEEKSCKARRQQIAELVEFMSQCVRERNCSQQQESIVLMGDLNVNARTSAENPASSVEYSMLKSSLGRLGIAQDLVLAHTGEHPVTFGDVEETGGFRKPKEVVLTEASERMTQQSLDYIWLIHRFECLLLGTAH
mmetsp:Transcript_25463/g.39905  ORF Transcript_25463/g.39905 Transcript_25463/m.39905 type:complete len:257 (+) Transcript_25463:135-905(+)